MTTIVYVTPRATRTAGIDPALVPGPPPRSLSVVECSDGYVLALVYPGNVGCVLSVRARRCYGDERRDDVGPRVVAQLREVGVLVAWRDSKRPGKATADGHTVRPADVDWTGADVAIAQNRGAPRTAPKTGVVSLTLGDEYRDKLRTLAAMYWGGNCSEAVRGLLDWAVEEDRELAERLRR